MRAEEQPVQVAFERPQLAKPDVSRSPCHQPLLRKSIGSELSCEPADNRTNEWQEGFRTGRKFLRRSRREFILCPPHG
jgi:hypothetical protein